MSNFRHIALAVKYRPKSFDDVVEQDAIKIILGEQIRTETFKHAYLFSGPAGCGKTTAARIFASDLNRGRGNPIEVDAASNNGVDNVRNIIDDAKRKPLDSEYKVYIIDECFHKNTLIKTPTGEKRISAIKPGDTVYNLTGFATVTNVFVNHVFTNRLCCVTINGEEILTTVDHLFFTDDGWVEARNLRKGEIVYGYTTMSGLRRGISNNLELSQKNVLEEMQKHFNISDGNREKGLRASSSADEREQSDDTSGNYSEDGRYENEKWEFSKARCCQRREWSLYEAADSFEDTSGYGVDIRICRSDELSKECSSLSYQLQSRPRLAKVKDSDRGGWCRPQYEMSAVCRRKENSTVEQFRVDSVEVYQPGNNDKLFGRYFCDSELHGETVEMYDLEIDGHPSYYANGILVHNCHMLSTGAWNALLKLLEEPPVCTVFVMCTTDPQKIPATILSRVQRYDFSKISLSQIADRLKMIIGNENQELEEFWGGHAKENGEELYSFEDDAVEYIAKLADGGMRDAITMLDKCMSLSREISVLNVVKALGTVNYATHFELLYAATTKQTSIGVTVLESVYNSGKDIKQFIKQFQYFVLDVCKFKLFGDFSFTNMPNLPEYEQKMGDEDYEECLKVLDWARQVNADIKWEANPKAFLETSFILFTRR